MKAFIGTVPEKIVFGNGKINELSQYVTGMGKKALIVTGRSVRLEKTALIGKVKTQLKTAGIDSVLFSEVEENPTSTTCNKGSEIARQSGCDMVVGVGGGSPMDTAKVIAMLAVNDGVIEDYMPGGKYSQKPDSELKCLPIVLVTTTSGTGSETTPFAVVTNPANNQKPGMGHDFWYAKVSIVDPELTLTMPKSVTIHTGLDAFFHAYEAYVSKAANEYADIFAYRAMELVVSNLEKCVQNPDDIEARSAMSLANSLAGTAISVAGTFAIHGMGHSISGHYNSIHGAALCAIAPELTDYACKGNIPKFAKVAVLLGADASLEERTLADQCGGYLAKFLDKFGMNIGLKSLGVKQEDIPTLADDALFAMSGAMEATPVKITREDAIKIYEKAMD